VGAFNFNTDNTFDVPYYANDYSMNTSSATYVSWNWKAGGAAASNTDGDITSSVSANPAAGFSIVSYTGVGTNAQSIGHGLSQTPEIIIVKNLDTDQDWTVMPGTSVLLGGSYYLELNQSSGKISNSNMFSSYANSTRFYTGVNSQTNENTKDFIAYCFHSVEGYSKVGSYTGNGVVDGPFIYTGMKPAFLLVKNIPTGARQWFIFDSARDTYNIVEKKLYPNLSNAEADADAYDFVSNGFKVRSTDANWNTSGESYLYYAIAESPFKTSNAR